MVVGDTVEGCVGFGGLKMFHGWGWASHGSGFVIILHAEEGAGMICGMSSRSHRVANICQSKNCPVDILTRKIFKKKTVHLFD